MDKTLQTIITRHGCNPLITPEDVIPSRENFVVIGVFNCGATVYKGEVILLCRVAEAIYSDDLDCLKIPVVRQEGGKSILDAAELRKSEHPELCFKDSRTVTLGDDANRGIVCLTSLSHLRIARSRDGVHFSIDDKPTIMPNAGEECWGIEDPRITKIGDTYYINYTAASEDGAVVSLITTKDFCEFQRHGVIFLPENKDVTIFPEKIGGKYWAFCRPVPHGIGSPDMWLTKSKDLIHWGEYSHFHGVSEDGWENGRVGGGAPPVKTPKGWVKIYHAADRNNRYALGVFLLDADDPAHVLAKSEEPLLYPEASYETDGFFGGVVFTCGCLLEGENIVIYYGAADDKVCRADISFEALYQHLGV